MLCTSFVQLYYSDAGYGIGTGLVAGIQGVVDFGWTREEAEHALKCIQKSARGKLVEKVRKPIILSVLVLPPISFLDLGVRELVLRPDDSDVLIELD